jgi:hypothetical protein
MLKNSFIVILGASGIGKGTLWKETLLKFPKIKYLPSETSRNLRKGESQENPYFFISKTEFENRINNKTYLEYDFHHDNYYGTNLKKLMKILKTNPALKEMDINGVTKIKNSNSFKYSKKDNTITLVDLDKTICFKIYFLGIIGDKENQSNIQRELRDKGLTQGLQDRIIRAKKEEEFCKKEVDFTIINPHNNIQKGIENLNTIIKKILNT